MDPPKSLFEIQNLITGPEFSCQIHFNTEHSILKGHFPGNPVVPGAWLIRAIHETIELITGVEMKMAEAAEVKFLIPVETEKIDRLTLRGDIQKKDELHLRVNASLYHSDQVFVKFKGTFTSILS